MFTLIKREIEDNIVYFIGAVVFSALFITIYIAMLYNADIEREKGILVILAIVAVLVMIGFSCAMGVSQMYYDKSKKISALLSTLPVTRDKILTARVIAGIIMILLYLLPLAVTFLITSHHFMPPFPVFKGIVTDIFIGIFLLSFACYCIGLQTGWTASRIAPSLGALVLTGIFAPIVIVKGFGTPLVFFLLLFITASLIRTCQKFNRASL